MDETNAIDVSTGTEQMPKGVIQRVFRDKTDVRITIAVHPVTKQVAPCVPYKDFAEAFSYDKTAIRKMISRSQWLKKHSVEVIMSSTDGKYYSTLCMFEECALGVFMKLEPERCQNKEVAGRIEELQEHMMSILRDALREYRTTSGKDEEALAQAKAQLLRLQIEERTIGLLDKVRKMPGGEYKNAAIDRLELLTGKRFTRPIQGELDFKPNP